MLYFTLIVRQQNALVLAADTDTCSEEIEQCKATAKGLLRKLTLDGKKLSVDMPPLLTVSWKNYLFYILAESGVLFLTMCDVATPASIPQAYLEDVAREFLLQYGSQVEAATRPYCFIKFDLYLLRTKKVFTAPSSSRLNIARSGRPMPVKRSYQEIMSGIQNKPTPSSLPSSAADDGNYFFWVATLCLLAVAILIILVYVFYLSA
ncbi:SNARE domain-containing protein, putative [Trypanosoma equiperdum]|uniref:Longin domain-containing protein n=4 Tax=Trypanozoon TaxID=39700 RepID=Q388Z8_TRYB2|nr:hypothetical protein, conserved [Trypanosoma brucei gambiense DAL972]XP_823450.1 hypothetical protein, conserved [Trypanosoma brucei brucei TREU927]RHW69061.1 SNARE domain-containing protein [Trypanosoma brucei equiperdum]SCU65052.1 SNARE domain-containing protein, putative [Trypanosoma equiperdum]EAN78622.1 hypothetical protein, conserved [Trypanosoma brucei brucei TREU927]CBH16401.1 hypothetical protein, conserved [Trypanosoma brucei gambiense DAL972]|eukprot:XP_011778665.1 hypothetical protein, conserved [Trypanosoma brucei gambiense DAL972]